MNRFAYTQHGQLYPVIDRVENKIIDVFASIIELLIEYPDADYLGLI